MSLNNQQQKSTEKFLQLIAQTQELFKDSATKQEVVDLTKTILEGVRNLNEKLSEKVAQNKDRMDRAVSSLEREFDDFKVRMTSETDTKMSKMYSEYINSLESAVTQLKKDVNNVQKLIPKLPDYTDRFKELEKKIPEPLVELPIEQQRSYTRDLLEGIQEEEEKLAISAIAHLEEKLDELFKRATGGTTTGGFNYAAIEIHIIDDETPTGTIDGSNQSFTIKHSPSPVSSLKVYMNGARMRITEDYTFSGKTITFVTAPPIGSILLTDYRI